MCMTCINPDTLIYGDKPGACVCRYGTYPDPTVLQCTGCHEKCEDCHEGGATGCRICESGYLIYSVFDDNTEDSVEYQLCLGECGTGWVQG
jgi:hypothetical protein